GQRLPLAAGPQHVENSVQNLAHVNRALAAAGLGRRDHRLDNRPFGASQITRITKTAAVSSNAMFRLPHRVLPRESSANTESQPIHRTQQLPGSALSSASRLIALSRSSSAARCAARFVPTGVRKPRILSSAIGSLFASNSDDRARDRKASMHVSRRVLM